MGGFVATVSTADPVVSAPRGAPDDELPPGGPPATPEEMERALDQATTLLPIRTQLAFQPSYTFPPLRRERHGRIDCTPPEPMRELGPWVTLLSSAYLVSMMFALGLELGVGPKESKTEKRGKRRMLAWGLAFHLLALPALAFGVTRLLHLSDDVTIALLILMVAPGGRFAPHLVKLSGANVALAIEVTLFLAKLTGFTAAPLAKWMLTLHSLEVRELPLIAQLVLLQLLPYVIGKQLRKRDRARADQLMRPAHRLAIFFAVASLVVVLVKGDRGLGDLLGQRGWIAVAIVTLASPVLGWFAGGAKRVNRKAFAIMADSRELALALVIASIAYPGTGVHTALFAIWSVMAFASFFLATALRAPRETSGAAPKLTAGDPALGGPAAARSAPAR